MAQFSGEPVFASIGLTIQDQPRSDSCTERDIDHRFRPPAAAIAELAQCARIGVIVNQAGQIQIGAYPFGEGEVSPTRGMDRGDPLMLEIHRPAKTDSACPNGRVGLGEEGSALFADSVKHPFAPAGTQCIALQNRQPMAFAIKKGEAEMRAPNVNGEYIIQKALPARAYVIDGMW